MKGREIPAGAGGLVAGSVVVKRAAAAPCGVRFGVRSPLPNVSLRERALLVKRIGFDGIELGNEWVAKPLRLLVAVPPGYTVRPARTRPAAPSACRHKPCIGRGEPESNRDLRHLPAFVVDRDR